MKSAGIEIAGLGAVSPAGWGVKAMRDAIKARQAAPVSDLNRPGWKGPMRVRTVPQGVGRYLGHARLRRASPISRFAVGAALEALGETDNGQKNDKPADTVQKAPESGRDRLGVVLCVMTGCVNYSRRFYDEVLREPATASPLLFPETVFNAPSSHIAALLGAGGANYTIVGDPGSFLVGMSVAANWLLNRRVDSCLVIGAEEMDWIVADSFRLFTRSIVLSEGAGAIYLRRSEGGTNAVALQSITDPHLFLSQQSRNRAVRKMRAELPQGDGRQLLCDGIQDVRRVDAAEEAAWCTWAGTRLS